MSLLKQLITSPSGGAAKPEEPWIDDWNYRKSHDIEGVTAEQTNYQVKIKVHYGTPAKYLIDWTKSTENPIHDFGGQSWAGAAYEDGRIYLFYTTGLPDKDIKCYSFTPANADDFTEWTDHGTVSGLGDADVETWENWNREPHSLVWETQTMADTREGVGEDEGTRKWRLYYGARTNAGGSSADYGIGYATSSNLTNGGTWTRDTARNPLPIDSATPPDGNADPHVALYDGKMYLATRDAPTPWTTKLYYCAEEDDQGVNANWTDLGVFSDDPAAPFGADMFGVEDGIVSIGDRDVDPFERYAIFYREGTTYESFSGNPIIVHSDVWEGGYEGHSALVQTKDYTAKIDGIYYYLYFSAANLGTLGLATSTTLLEGDYGEDVYLNEKCMTDFGDVRFTDSDKETELDYWMEEKVDSDYAIFWADVLTIPADPDSVTTYGYYGKAGETTGSNAKTTFPLGDDFGDNSRDTDLWDEHVWNLGTVAEVNQRLECTTPAGAGYKSAGYVSKVSHDLTQASLEVEVISLTANSSIVLVLSLTKLTDGDLYGEADWYRILKNRAVSKCAVQHRKEGGGVSTLYEEAWTAATGKLRIVISGGTIKFYEGDDERHSEAYDLSSYTAYLYIYASGDVGRYGTDSFDTFFLRNYVSPEPAHGAWGAEESH